MYWTVLTSSVVRRLLVSNSDLQQEQAERRPAMAHHVLCERTALRRFAESVNIRLRRELSGQSLEAFWP